MKNGTRTHRVLIVFIPIVLIAAFFAVYFLVIKSPATPEKAAEAVLRKIYSATLKDYETMDSLLTSSRDNDKPLLDYVHATYPGQFTENGYKHFLLNRVMTRAILSAHDDNSDVKVLQVTLAPADSEEGSKNFSYNIQLQAEKDASKIHTFKGSIKLVRENDAWKVDGIS